MLDAAAFAPPPLGFWDRVRNNAEIAARSGSSYVVLIAAALGTLYGSMSPEQQKQLVEAWPILKGATPYVTLVVAFVLTKLRPSSSMSAQTKGLIDELARRRLNDFLRAHGGTELPTPPTVALPDMPIVVPVPVRVPVPVPRPPMPLPPPPPPVDEPVAVSATPVPVPPPAPVPAPAPTISQMLIDPALEPALEEALRVLRSHRNAVDLDVSQAAR